MTVDSIPTAPLGAQPDATPRHTAGGTPPPTAGPPDAFDVALFKGTRDTHPQRQCLTWGELRALLTSHDVRQRKDGRLWSPTSYPPTAPRANENVLAVSCLVLDFDRGCRPDDLIRAWKAQGLAVIWHSTHSHTREHPKWRAIFPLASLVPGAAWERTFGKLTAALAAGQADPACKDASRLFYLPSCPPEHSGHAFAFAIDGRPVDPADYPEPAKPAIPHPATLNGYTPGATTGGNPRYAEAALRDEVAAVAAASEGTRNDQLNRSSFKLATLVGGGHLDEGKVREIMAAAGATAGLTQAEIKETVGSGMRAGVQKPRTVPEPGTARHAAEPSDGITYRPEEPGLPLGLPLDDIGNGRRFALQHQDKARYCPAWETWLTWDGRRWDRDSRGATAELAKNTARRIAEEAGLAPNDRERTLLLRHAADAFKRGKRETMLKDAASVPGIPVMPEELDHDPWLFNVQNGTIDLRTGDLRPHDSNALLTKIAVAEYHPEARCANFISFLRAIMNGSDELVAYLRRAIGYALTGDTREQCLFILWGVGSNGKSTLLNILSELLGDYSEHAKEEVLMAKRYETQNNEEIANLHGARLVTAVETEADKRLAEARVKQLTGGDPISACRKFEHQFTFTPIFKLFLSTNHQPEVRGTDHAIWRRIHLVPFEVKFWLPNRGETGPPELQADLNLLDKLRAERDGILAWAVQGCLEWQQQGLGMPGAVKTATQGYREEMDVLGAFISEHCIMEPTAEAAAGAIYKVYTGWCERTGQGPMSQTKLGKQLRERGAAAEKGTGGKRLWRGIKLHEPAG